MLGVPEVVEDAVRLLLGVVPLHGVPVMEGPVDGAASQGGDGQHRGDDGERGDNFPPHFICNQDLSHRK